jgi:hypothetical protein
MHSLLNEIAKPTLQDKKGGGLILPRWAADAAPEVRKQKASIWV